MIQKRRVPAHGSRGPKDGKTIKRTAISFPDEMFDEVRKRALGNGVSFSEQVRLYIQWGMEVTESED